MCEDTPMNFKPQDMVSARTRLGLTQAQLAQRIGCTQAAVSHYESGARQPSVETLAALLAALGLRMEVLPAKRRRMV